MKDQAKTIAKEYLLDCPEVFPELTDVLPGKLIPPRVTI
jgi:hypothetical protein